MAFREFQAIEDDAMEAETVEEALGLMVGRLHPRKDVPEYLTYVRQREVYPAAALAGFGEVLKEANRPTLPTLKWLGIAPDDNYKIYKKVGTQRVSSVVDGQLIQKIQNIYEERIVDAVEYAKFVIRTDRGIAQGLVFAILSKHLDNYRVSTDGMGRRGGISIGTSMVTGKQETSMGVIGRFRRALGK